MPTGLAGSGRTAWIQSEIDGPPCSAGFIIPAGRSARGRSGTRRPRSGTDSRLAGAGHAGLWFWRRSAQRSDQRSRGRRFPRRARLGACFSGYLFRHRRFRRTSAPKLDAVFDLLCSYRSPRLAGPARPRAAGGLSDRRLSAAQASARISTRKIRRSKPKSPTSPTKSPITATTSTTAWTQVC